MGKLQQDHGYALSLVWPGHLHIQIVFLIAMYVSQNIQLSNIETLIQRHISAPMCNCLTLVHEFKFIYDHTKLN